MTKNKTKEYNLNEMISAIKLIHILGKNDQTFRADDSAFVIATCQRSIILQTVAHDGASLHECYEGKQAYTFLLETICGLKSKLLGESEIVSQFKEAFSKYIENQNRSNVIIKVLEKLFKDAKDIRRDYLLEIGQQSYAGISRKILQKTTQNKVLILGSGKLAYDVIKQLGKRFEIYLSARNILSANELMQKFPDQKIQFITWEERNNFYDFTNIINTIGSVDILFNHDFFKSRKANNDIFIDLGSPSVISTTLDSKSGVYRLEDVFAHGHDLNQIKEQKISNAKGAILDVVEKRSKSLGHNYPFSWEELQFSY